MASRTLLSSIAITDSPTVSPEMIAGKLGAAGLTQVKKLGEKYVAEYCDDCGAPLFADPSGELVHAEMPEDALGGELHRVADAVGAVGVLVGVALERGGKTAACIFPEAGIVGDFSGAQLSSSCVTRWLTTVRT